MQCSTSAYSLTYSSMRVNASALDGFGCIALSAGAKCLTPCAGPSAVASLPVVVPVIICLGVLINPTNCGMLRTL